MVTVYAPATGWLTAAGDVTSHSCRIVEQAVYRRVAGCAA